MNVATDFMLNDKCIRNGVRGGDAAATTSLSKFHFSAGTEALKYVTRFYAGIAQSLSGSASLYRLAHGHRFFGRAGDGADGPLLRLQRHDHDDDRSHIDRPLDRFDRSEILRGSLASQHPHERPPPGDRRRVRSRSGRGRIFGLEPAGWSHDVGGRRRIRRRRPTECRLGTSWKGRPRVWPPREQW